MRQYVRHTFILAVGHLLWFRNPLFLVGVALIHLFCGGFKVVAQARSLIAPQIDVSQTQPLPSHHPMWANAANDLGAVSPGESIEDLTIVLNRPDELEKAFDQFLREQQDPASPNYRHWLTPQEVGARFGPSDADIQGITSWLQSEGLHINWVAPSKMFVGFGGTASDISRAFGTEPHRYNVNGQTRISISSDAVVPVAVTPAIKAIRGLFTINEEPQHVEEAMQWDSPQITTANGNHFIGPGDFATIYGLPSGTTGTGVTIGIVGRSRTNFADFTNFNSILNTNIPIPTEIVPTTFGGVDPGPAYTSPPGNGISTGDQGEATLDVMRAGSVAPKSTILLVVATNASGGISTDAQYLINTTPVPAQVISISFGACEIAAGPAGVNYWDSVFKQAAAEGISTFVASGDSGASGCDFAFTTPPATPQANSPNYICSSSYATCVGGTEFNDVGGNQYWSGSSLGRTALSYIPEGGWNESWNGTTPTVAASGGGVSSVIPTPSWQQGVPGVPTANAGRYTPDISFSSSLHDGYFACFAAGGAGCVVTNGSFAFTAFAGTSAAAPGMAGIAALLDQVDGGPQGNLNPGLYQMWLSAPSSFHDVTVATSGVSSCDINTPSMCNNSIPGSAGLSGGQPGYAVGVGFDEVTGLGSLNASTFINSYATGSKLITPTVQVPSISRPVNQDFQVIVSATSSTGTTPTGSVVLTVGSYTSSSTTLQNGSANITITAGKLAQGTYTMSAAYTPDAAGAKIYNPATGTGQLTVTAPQYIAPNLVVTPTPPVITNAMPVSVAIAVSGGSGHPIPTGTVSLASGAFSTGPATLVSNSAVPDAEATLSIPAGTLPQGTDTLTVTYTPDTAGAYLYITAQGTATVNNQGARIVPVVVVTPSSSQITNTQSVVVRVQVQGYPGNPTPTGTMVVNGGSYTSSPATLSNGIASTTFGPLVLPVGSDQLTATYTPDSQSANIYTGASGSGTVGVSLSQKITPAITVTPTPANTTAAQPLTVAIALSGGAGNPQVSGLLNVTSPQAGFNYAQSTTNGTAAITIPAGSVPVGAFVLNVDYAPDPQGAYFYNSASSSTSLNVPKTTPAVTVTPSLSNLSTQQTLQLTASVGGGPGTVQTTGTIIFSSGAYTSGSVSLNANGSATATMPAGYLAPGTSTITAKYNGDTRYNSATGTASVVVTAPAGAAFGLSGINATVSKGSIGSTIVTVTPVNGFVGAVAVSAAITGSPAGAQNPPTISFGQVSSVNVLNFQPALASLNITTTASTAGANTIPSRPGSRWYAGGAGALACVLVLFLPLRRRGWNLARAIVLFAILAGTVSCGGGGGGSGNSGSSSGGGGGNGGSSGTTSGQYTVTVTGTSGSITATTTLIVTVQ